MSLNKKLTPGRFRLLKIQLSYPVFKDENIKVDLKYFMAHKHFNSNFKASVHGKNLTDLQVEMHLKTETIT